MVLTLSSVTTLVSAVPPLAHAAAAAQVLALQTEEHCLEQGEEAPVQQLGHQVRLLYSASSGHLPHVKRVLSLTTPGLRLSQCKKKYPSSFSTYFTPVVHANDDPLCWNLKLWGNFDFFTFLF